jgi:serine/threonine protein kinase
MLMGETRICPECGYAVPAETTLGVCPGCSNGMALDQPAGPELFQTAGVREEAHNAGEAGATPHPRAGAATDLVPERNQPPPTPDNSTAKSDASWDLTTNRDLPAGATTDSPEDWHHPPQSLEQALVETPASRINGLNPDPFATHACSPESSGDSDESALALSASALFGAAPPGYAVLDELGHGGMGVVYKATQTKLNRLVALKMIRGGAEVGAAQLERFRIEAEALARLRHPNVVQIFDVGEVMGRPFFSLELLEGGSLADKIDGTPQRPRFCAELLATLALAVAAAHEAGVIHRDLKPQNVLFDRDGTPKITDFGLAKRLDVESGLTITLQVMGTPAYMAPEQALGLNDKVGPAADIYALGAILYTMLTGRAPLHGTNWRETLKMVVADEPLPPSRLQPRIPRDLETITLKCLSKEPTRRYPTGKSLADDLRRYLSGAPILARPVPFWERGLKWARRRPATVSLSLLAAAALIGIVGGLVNSALTAQSKRLAAEGELIDLLTGSREELSIARMNIDRKEIALAASKLEDIEKSLKETPPAIRSDPRLAKLLAEVGVEIKKTRDARESIARRQNFEKKLEDFKECRNDALFFDTALDRLEQAGRNPKSAVAKATRALDLFTRHDEDGARTLERFPQEAKEDEKSEVISGCYEMIFILAEDVFRDASVIDPKNRAKRALRILDSAPRLALEFPDTRAYHSRRKSYLAGLGDKAGFNLETVLLAKLQPARAFDRYLYGLELYKKDDFTAAIHEFKATREQDHGLFWAKVLLALSMIQEDKTSEAQLVLDECVLARPDYAWLRMLRGIARGRSDLEGALVDFRVALEQLDKTGRDDKELRYALWLAWGSVLKSAASREQSAESAKTVGDHLEQAAQYLKKAIELAPARSNAYHDLALVRLGQGQFDGALAQLDLALERIAPGQSDTVTRRIRAQTHEKKAKNCALAAELAEKSAHAQAASASRALATRERLAAIDDYAAIRHGPADDPLDVASDLVGRAWLMCKVKRAPTEWLKLAEEALVVFNKSSLTPRFTNKARELTSEALLLKSLASLDLDRFDDAIAACDESLALKGTDLKGADARLFATRGKAWEKKGDLRRAISDYDRSLGLRPDQLHVLIDVGWARLFYGFPQTSPNLALEDFNKAIFLDKDNADAHSGRGNALAALKIYDQAVADAAIALERDPDSPRNQHCCARIYAMAGDPVNARDRKAKPGPAWPIDYHRRAVRLLIRVLHSKSPAERLEFDREMIQKDEAFRFVRDDPSIVASRIHAEKVAPKPATSSATAVRR